MKKLIFLLIVFLFAEIKSLGPKQFVLEGRFWCRDRVSHPGRQCCDTVSQETPTAIPLQATTTTHINKVDRGYGHSCDTTCKCKTVIPPTKCKTDSECRADGHLSKCIKGACKFPCTYKSDCIKKYGDDYDCVKKFCESKPPKKTS